MLGAMEYGIPVKLIDSIQLRTSDGRVLETQVAAIGFVSGENLKSYVAFHLPSDVKEQDTPLGTEIWLVRYDGVEKNL